MQFYQIPSLDKNLQDPLIIKSSGLPLLLFSQILKIIGKKKPNLTMDSIENIVTTEDCLIEPVNKESSTFISKISKSKSLESFALVEANQLFNLKAKNETFQFFLFGNNLFLGKNLSNLLKEKLDTFNQLSDTEKKVWKWLDSSETGKSSLTLCSYLFPNLQHEKLQSFIEEKYISLPRDLSDFSRCLNFVNKTSITKEQLDSLNISEPWNSLISQWDTLASYHASDIDSVRQQGKSLLHSINEFNNKPKPSIKP